MSRSRLLVSAFIVFHGLALAICAIPAPADIPEQVPVDRSRLTGLGRLAPLFDALALREVALNRVVWGLIHPIRGPFSLYMSATHQTRQWNMFFQPPIGDNYVHLKYYVAEPGSADLRVYRELIAPAHPGGHFRGFGAYAASFRDKAIDNAYKEYRKRLDSDLKRTDSKHAAEFAQEAVLPVIRAFAKRFASRSLIQGERMTRAELWRGLALLPEPGHASDAGIRSERQALLDTYDAATVAIIPASLKIPLRATTREIDITWTLLGRVEWK